MIEDERETRERESKKEKRKKKKLKWVSVEIKRLFKSLFSPSPFIPKGQKLARVTITRL